MSNVYSKLNFSSGIIHNEKIALLYTLSRSIKTTTTTTTTTTKYVYLQNEHKHYLINLNNIFIILS